MSIFDQFVTGAQVEQAVIAHLRYWQETYLAEAERQYDYDPRKLPLVRAWTTSPSVDNWPSDQLPMVLVVSTGLSGDPRRTGDGYVAAAWEIGLATITSARSEEETGKLAKIYFAVCRTILLQHPELGDFATATHWLSERYDALPAGEERRSLAAAFGTFRVDVEGVANQLAGPIGPPEDPYAPPAEWPEVETTQVEIS